MPIPLLFLSDSVTAGTGLSRITCDIAVRVAEHMPEFRVGTAGYGGPFKRSLGFPQYQIEMRDWMVLNLPELWRDFSGDQHGILFLIWDSSRALWLSRPENCAAPHLRKFLETKPFDLWTYTPLDATGPNNRLTSVLKHTLEGFHRVLAYTKWSEAILRRTLEGPTLDGLTNLPHGLDSSVFYQRPRQAARQGFGERIGARERNGAPLTIPDDALMIGIVATNQIRKDWGLGIAAVAEVARKRKIVLWAHTDELERHWSLPALLNDFGLLNNTVVTTIPLSDEQMAFCYSAADCTLGIGNGEGWGLPLSESLACGTPVVHGNYGGGTDFVPPEFLIEPLAYRLEGLYNCRRAVYTPEKWAQKIMAVAGKRTALPKHLDWNNLWPRWESWFREGLNAASVDDRAVITEPAGAP